MFSSDKNPFTPPAMVLWESNPRFTSDKKILIKLHLWPYYDQLEHLQAFAWLTHDDADHAFFSYYFIHEWLPPQDWHHIQKAASYIRRYSLMFLLPWSFWKSRTRLQLFSYMSIKPFGKIHVAKFKGNISGIIVLHPFYPMHAGLAASRTTNDTAQSNPYSHWWFTRAML